MRHKMLEIIGLKRTCPHSPLFSGPSFLGSKQVYLHAQTAQLIPLVADI
jgi:hypothetical protein